MSAEEPGHWLFSRATGGIRWGLERTEALLAGVGDPHRRFRSLHVGGTNGKGSVSALCESVLRQTAGRRVGMYTSPHLVSFDERIRVDGAPVDRELLLTCEARLRPAIEASGATFFEATTAIAFLCFAEAGVDVAVVEVGLGGRLDATNVLTPLVTGVTGVALDHTEYLGTTLPEIAGEKAGIFKAGVPAVCGPMAPELEEVFRARALEVGAPFLPVAHDAVSEVAVSLDGTSLRLDSRTWGDQRVELGLIGAHQARNAAVAAEMLGALPGELRPDWPSVAAGFREARWPGRFDVRRVGSQTRILDVAHNEDGVAALCRTLDAVDAPRPLVLLTAILGDKDWGAMLPPLVERADAVILTVAESAPEERRWDPQAAAGAVRGRPVRVIPDFAAALARAETLAPHGTVLVTGSVYTVGEALALTPRPPLPITPGRGGERPGRRGTGRVRGTTPAVEDRARMLRRDSTEAEELLWAALRHRPGDLKFRRQHPVGRHILDFYCPAARLCVEVDGAVHAGPDQRERDLLRDEALRAWGITTLRFTNDEVMRDVGAVIARINSAAS